MTKRRKFVISSVSLALGFIAILFVDFSFRYWAITTLSFLALAFSFWSLKDGVSKDATLLTLILPPFFTAGVGLFYFLLPATLLTRIPVLVLYAIGIYALLLTSNIYNVATERSIALLRAAHAVGFLLTLVTSFLLFDTILSLKESFWVNGLGMFVISLPLFLQGFWSVELGRQLSREVLYYSLGFSTIVGESATVLSFWPVTVAVASLALTTLVYVGLGLGQAKLQQRLFSKTVKEYLLVGVVVFATMFFTARWGG